MCPEEHAVVTAWNNSWNPPDLGGEGHGAHVEDRRTRDWGGARAAERQKPSVTVNQCVVFKAHAARTATTRMATARMATARTVIDLTSITHTILIIHIIRIIHTPHIIMSRPRPLHRHHHHHPRHRRRHRRHPRCRHHQCFRHHCPQCFHRPRRLPIFRYRAAFGLSSSLAPRAG